MEVLVLLSLKSIDLHTLQVHPITGTPCDVPVPRKVIIKSEVLFGLFQGIASYSCQKVG